MLGNASELISQTRCSKILEAVNPSWGKYGSGDFPSAKDTHFADNFQSTFTKWVEKDVALSKAVSITKRSKREGSPSTTKRGEQKRERFFRGGPPAKYGGRQDRSFSHTTHIAATGKENAPSQGYIRFIRDQATSHSSTNLVSQRKPNPSSFKTPRPAPRRHIGNLRYPNGYEAGAGFCTLPGRGPPCAFCGKLEKAVTRSMDRRVNYRMPHRIPVFTNAAKKPKRNSTRGRQGTDHVQTKCKVSRPKTVVRVPDNGDGFINSIFLVPKTDGSWRPVLNLKALNWFVVKHHFKMESLRTVKGLVQPEDRLVKLDLKDAYLTVPIHPLHRMFLKFQWNRQMWQFKVLPFGLSTAPYIFTKLLTHCNGLALYGRLVRLVRSNSVWHSGWGLYARRPWFDSVKAIFSLFSKLFLIALIIHEVYI